MSRLDQLREMLEDGTVSLRDLERATGYSRSTISQVLAGKYSGNVTQVEDGLRRFLDEWESRQNLALTKPFRAVQTVLDLTEKHRELAVIVGDSGIGKTEATKYWCMMHQGTAYVAVQEGINKPELLEMIGRALGISLGTGTVAQKLLSIQKALRVRPRMIIVDEADRLNVRQLEALRDIYDDGNAALVLIGLPRLVEIMKRGQSLRENLAQLYSRVGFRRVLPRPDRDDVEAIAEKYHYRLTRPFIAEILGWMHGEGEFRRLVKLFERAKLFLDGKEWTVDACESAVRQAYTLLIS